MGSRVHFYHSYGAASGRREGPANGGSSSAGAQLAQE